MTAAPIRPTRSPTRVPAVPREQTPEGKNHIRLFAYEMLVPDDGVFLEIDVIERAFATYEWKGKPSGFQVEDSDAFFRELCDARGFRSHDDLAHGTGICARFKDAIGFEAFDPDEQEDSEVEYLVDRLLPLGGVNMFVALPETLKTWTALDLARAVSVGGSWLGFKILRPGRVAIVDYEMGSKEMRRRLKLLGADHRVFFKSHPPFGLNDEEFWVELKKLRPDLVIIDSLAAGSSVSGDDFGILDSRAAKPLGRAARFAEEMASTGTRPAFLVLHHSPKGCSVRDVESVFLGSAAIRGKVDSGFFFEKLGENHSRLVPVKTRKGQKAPTLEIRFSDTHGLQLVTPEAKPRKGRTPKVKRTDDELFLDAVRATPGTTVTDLAEALGWGRAKVAKTRKRLEEAGRIEDRGDKTTARLFDRFAPSSTSKEQSDRSNANGDQVPVAAGDSCR